MAITFLPYFNNKGVSQIPRIDFLRNNEIETIQNMPSYVLPAEDIRAWADSANVGASLFILDVGNYTYIDAYKFNSGQIAINIHYQNVVIARQEFAFSNYEYMYLAFGADYENEMGYISTILYNNSTQILSANHFSWETRGTEFFNMIKVIQPTPPILYNWQSVPSISGKNGIYTLSTLNDINNGSAITTSDTTKFVLSSETNIARLISDKMNQGT